MADDYADLSDEELNRRANETAARVRRLEEWDRSYRDAWVAFAAAVVGTSDAPDRAREAAQVADALVEELRRRDGGAA